MLQRGDSGVKQVFGVFSSGGKGDESVKTKDQVIVGGLLWLGGNSWQWQCENMLEIGPQGKQSWVCVQLKWQPDSQGAPIDAEWATSYG